MKIITQEEFDNLPRNEDGRKVVPAFTDLRAIQSFGECCSISNVNGYSFGKGYSISNVDGYSFGKGYSISNVNGYSFGACCSFGILEGEKC